MSDEGIFIPQGSGRKIFRLGTRSFCKIAITALAVAIFACEGQAGSFNNKEHFKLQKDKSIESKELSKRIKQLVCGLKCSDAVAGDFVTMVNNWQDRKGNSFFTIRSEELHHVRENYTQGRSKIGDVVKVERRIIGEIVRLIKNEIDYSDGDFELADVIKNKRANCLGYSQLFYILGSSVELSVIPINAVELQSPGPLPTGAAHVSCITNLSDGRTIMLNLVPGGFISKPFVMGEKFEKTGNYRELKSESNPLNIYRKIQLLDKEGLIAYIHSNRGNVYASIGRFNQSICDYTTAVKFNPNLAEAYNNRGVAYRKLGQLKQAITDYSKAIELNPSYAEAYNNRGVAYEKLGNLHQCIRDYNKSIELNPKFAGVYNNRANAYVKLGQYNHAIPDYDRAINKDSRLAKAYGNRAIAYALLGKPEGARKDLLTAIKLNPNLRSQVRRMSDKFKLGLKFD